MSLTIMEGECSIGESLEGDPMKIKRCPCGVILTGKQKVRCAQCAIKENPGSSQCPYCFRWFISHGGNSYSREREHHARAACRKEMSA